MGTPGWAGPLTTSLRGLWVSGLLPPYNGGPRLPSRTDCFINATPSRRPDAVGWAHSVWQARWLPPFGDCGSVATCPVQWRTVHEGGDPKTDQEGTTRTPGWHEEKATLVTATKVTEVLPNQRGLRPRTPKGRAPRTLASWRH